jgi:hypothetical protein
MIASCGGFVTQPGAVLHISIAFKSGEEIKKYSWFVFDIFEDYIDLLLIVMTMI